MLLTSTFILPSPLHEIVELAADDLGRFFIVVPGDNHVVTVHDAPAVTMPAIVYDLQFLDFLFLLLSLQCRHRYTIQAPDTSATRISQNNQRLL
jgi:hypothetical protein